MIECIKKKFEKQRSLLREIKGTFLLNKEDIFIKEFSKKIILVQLPTKTEEWVRNFHLTRLQFESLKKTLKERGEKNINLAIIELEEDISLESSEEYYIFDLNTTYEEYSNFQIINECVLYGENKEWAILVSSEDISILAGIPNFIKMYKENYLYWKNDLKKFKELSEYILEEYHSEWGKKFLESIIQEEEDLLSNEKKLLLCNK